MAFLICTQLLLSQIHYIFHHRGVKTESIKEKYRQRRRICTSHFRLADLCTEETQCTLTHQQIQYQPCSLQHSGNLVTFANFLRLLAFAMASTFLYGGGHRTLL